MAWRQSLWSILDASAYEDEDAPSSIVLPWRVWGWARRPRADPLDRAAGDVEPMAMYAGQGVGAIDAVEPAAAVVERFAAALRPT